MKYSCLNKADKRDISRYTKLLWYEIYRISDPRCFNYKWSYKLFYSLRVFSFCKVIS